MSFDVTNRGGCVAADVPQLYVSEPSAPVKRPRRELKGFERVELKPGERRRVTMDLDRDAFAYWDEGTRDWKVSSGRFVVAVGASSRDLKLDHEVVLR
ncbi:MAG: fibronectin type III-like domain-contianing protein [Candidatus Eisenbacteria bacterium]|nr:fibronectin type III-like domain-contianing protein [Candidatus Eisenbacteria bacterium]